MFNKKSPEPETPEAKAARKAKNRKRRLIAYGSLTVVLYGVWIWQPYQVDLFPKQPDANPPVNPDTSFLFSSRSKVLVVTAHPDDSAFYIGGFLTQLGRSGAEIHQIICTDGDKAYYGPFADPESLRPVRRAEAQEELQTWHGRIVTFLGKPDGRLRADDDLVQKIRQRIDEIKPDYVVCFDGDYPPRITHQDHRRSGDAAERAIKGAPSVKWLMKFSTHAPNWICDISRDWEAQTKLLQIHRSQFHGERLERVTNMVEDLAAKDGDRISAAYGEGFRCIRLHP